MKKSFFSSKAFRILIWVLIAIFLCVFLYSGYRIWSYYAEKSKADHMYDDIMSSFAPTTPSKPQSSGGKEEQTEPSDDTGYKPQVDAKKIAAEYPDFVGWLYSPDTPINYPVMQASDNDYYLHRLMDGSYNYNGCLFADYRCDKGFANDNTLIYGHNMFSGIMFGTLQKYKSADYYAEHPVMYFETEYGVYELEVFAAYTTTHDSDAYTISFSSETAYLNFLNNAISQSAFNADVQLTAADRIVTLSTCAYEFDNARFVVLCKVSQRMDTAN